MNFIMLASKLFGFLIIFSVYCSRYLRRNCARFHESNDLSRLSHDHELLLTKCVKFSDKKSRFGKFIAENRSTRRNLNIALSL